MTIIFGLLILSYGITKLQVLINRSDFKIQVHQIDNYLQPDYQINLNDSIFKFAFAVVDDDGNIKDDPEYVQWLVRMRTSVSGQNDTYQPIKTHYCTKKNWE